MKWLKLIEKVVFNKKWGLKPIFEVKKANLRRFFFDHVTMKTIVLTFYLTIRRKQEYVQSMNRGWIWISFRQRFVCSLWRLGFWRHTWHICLSYRSIVGSSGSLPDARLVYICHIFWTMDYKDCSGSSWRRLPCFRWWLDLHSQLCCERPLSKCLVWLFCPVFWCIFHRPYSLTEKNISTKERKMFFNQFKGYSMNIEMNIKWHHHEKHLRYFHNVISLWNVYENYSNVD